MSSLATIKKKIARQKWYRQGAACKFCYVSVPWSSCYARTANWRRVKPDINFIGYLSNNFVTFFLAHENANNVAGWYLREETKKPSFLKKMHLSWKRRHKKFCRLVLDNLSLVYLSKLSDKELVQSFDDSVAEYLALYGESLFHDTFDLMGEIFLSESLRKKKIHLAGADLAILVANEELFAIQEERLELAKLARSIRRNRKLVGLIKKLNWPKIQKDFPVFSKNLTSHTHNYYWIHNDYAHIKRLNVAVFLKRTKALLENSRHFKGELNIAKAIAQARLKKRLLKCKLRLSSKIYLLTDLLSELAVWRDERKAMNQLGDELLYRFIKEFARRGKVPFAYAEYAAWWEVRKLLRPTKSFKEELSERRKGAFCLFSGPRSVKIITGKKGKELFEFMNSLLAKTDLAGKPAYGGKFKGVAKVVLGQHDFKKFKKGEILIAPNTRPEYVPIMKIAGAIVTEEGGITSHAAIVSRELKKPAVVGVQGILDAIKDGDVVEVDAEKGIVKKL